MPIKIATTNNLGENIFINIRELMVFDDAKNKYVEKFLLLSDQNDYSTNKTLIYGKAKIKFDFNLPRDGSGELMNYALDYSISHYDPRTEEYTNPSFSHGTFYFFANDGFYSFRNDHWYKIEEELSRIRDICNFNFWNNALSFKGWYVNIRGEEKKVHNSSSKTSTEILSVEELFKESGESIPEITLYAKWEVKKYYIRVHNITRIPRTSNEIIYDKKVSSSFKVRKTQKTITDSYTIYDIPYRTPLYHAVFTELIDFKYITWGKGHLDGTNKEKELRNGPQYLLPTAFATRQYSTIIVKDYDSYTQGTNENYLIDSNKKLTENIDIYPVFPLISIWKHSVIPKGSIYYNTNDKKVTLKKDLSVGGIYKLYGLDSSGLRFLPGFTDNDNNPKHDTYYFSPDGKYRYVWILVRIDYYPSAQLGFYDGDPNNSGATAVWKMTKIKNDWLI